MKIKEKEKETRTHRMNGRKEGKDETPHIDRFEKSQSKSKTHI